MQINETMEYGDMTIKITDIEQKDKEIHHSRYDEPLSCVSETVEKVHNPVRLSLGGRKGRIGEDRGYE